MTTRSAEALLIYWFFHPYFEKEWKGAVESRAYYSQKGQNTGKPASVKDYDRLQP
jgi:hypothetical protein